MTFTTLDRMRATTRRVLRLVLLATLCGAPPAWAGLQPVPPGPHGLGGVIGLPDPDPDAGERVPLLLWLHGFSQRGDDPRQLQAYGPVATWPVGRRRYALLAPQLPRSRLVWDAEAIEALLDAVVADGRIDDTRIVVMGASLGAAAAWRLAARRPGRYAAVIAVAGAGAERDVRAAGRMRARFFHGDRDRNVPLSKVERNLDALRAAGADATLVVLPGVGHAFEPFQHRVFEDAALLDWAFGTATGEEAEARVPRDDRRGGDRRDARAAERAVRQAIETLAAIPQRRAGSPGDAAARAWIARRLQDLGLAVRQDAFTVRRWLPRAATLALPDGTLAVGAVANTAFTDAAGVEAPLAYVEGLRAPRREDVAGRIVVIDARVRDSGERLRPRRAHWVSDPQGHFDDAVWEAAFPSNLLGAFVPGVAEQGRPDGLIGRIAARRDALAWAERLGARALVVLLPASCGVDETMFWPYDDHPKDLPAVYVPARDAARVRALARAGARARLSSTGAWEDGETANLWALLPGRDDSLVLVTSHHDSPYRGAVEDASGVALVLDQAARWAARPRAQRPRGLLFVFAAGHFLRGGGALRFAESHPDLMARAAGLVTVEHVLAREARPDPVRPGALVATGRPQRSVVYVPNDRATIARVVEALRSAPQPSLTVETPLLGGLPFTDAAGFVFVQRERDAPLPYASWISAPCYLITADDTPAWIDPTRIDATRDSVDALVDAFMR